MQRDIGSGFASHGSDGEAGGSNGSLWTRVGEKAALHQSRAEHDCLSVSAGRKMNVFQSCPSVSTAHVSPRQTEVHRC